MTPAADPAPADRSRFDAAAVAAFLLVVAAYSNHFGGGFHFDDSHVIQQNLYLRSLANLPRFFTDAMTFSSLPANATYRPLLSVTYALDYALGGGLASWSFHLTQFLIHLLVGLCAFFLIEGVLDRLAPARVNRWAALAGATLFLVHTANTETVNYLSSRSDELSTLGLLAGFLVYTRWPAGRRLQLHILPMVVGALAKPPAVLLGPVLLVYALLIEEGLSLGDVVRLRSPRRIVAALARTAPTIAAGALAFLLVEGMNPPAQDYGGPGRMTYLRTQLWVWLYYLRLFVLPMGLTADTDLRPIEAPWDTRVIVGALAALALSSLAWFASRTARGRAVAFGILWLFLGLLPSSSVFPLSEMMNEHRIYLPFIGLALAAAAALASLTSAPSTRARWRPMAAVVAAILAAHAIGTFQRNRVWRSEETLWADVVQKSPGNGRAWMNYGLTQMEVGRYDQALAFFQQAARLNPTYAHVHTNLGIVLDALGRPGEAEPQLREALVLQPDFVEGHFYLARWLSRHGRGPEALEHARRASELSAGYGPARSLAMDLLYASGRVAELGEAVRATLTVAPTNAEALAYAGGAPALAATQAPDIYNVGVERTAAQDHLGAALAYRRSAELAPTGDALNNLGWSLAQLGFPAEARTAYVEALRVEPAHERARNNLAALKGAPPPKS